MSRGLRAQVVVALNTNQNRLGIVNKCGFPPFYRTLQPRRFKVQLEMGSQTYPCGEHLDGKIPLYSRAPASDFNLSLLQTLASALSDATPLQPAPCFIDVTLAIVGLQLCRRTQPRGVPTPRMTPRHR
jgi:hypothetical protein